MTTTEEKPKIHTCSPVAWQRFGDEYCLTGQYGMRPIILCTRKGKLALRDQERDLLIPFDPNHPDAIHIAESFNRHDDLVSALKMAKETIFFFHGEVAWAEFQESPEMKKINLALGMKYV